MSSRFPFEEDFRFRSDMTGAPRRRWIPVATPPARPWRHAVVRAPDESWTVFDDASGLPAEHCGQTLIGLTLGEASAAAGRLNERRCRKPARGAAR